MKGKGSGVLRSVLLNLANNLQPELIQRGEFLQELILWAS